MEFDLVRDMVPKPVKRFNLFLKRSVRCQLSMKIEGKDLIFIIFELDRTNNRIRTPRFKASGQRKNVQQGKSAK